MWDNPRLLNLLANALFGVAAFIVLCLAVIGTLNSQLFPLRVLVVENELRYVDQASIALAVGGRVRGNFFGADLRGVRDGLQDLAWVRRAQVRREWPDRLVVRLEEQEPLARWSSNRLVNTHGELFEGRIAAGLPEFRGPEGMAATMTERYAEMGRIATPLAMQITQVNLSARHAWSVELVGKDQKRLSVMLGRDQTGSTTTARLARFVAVYPQTLEPLGRRTAAVDLRYPNGFALRVPGIERIEQKKSGSA